MSTDTPQNIAETLLEKLPGLMQVEDIDPILNCYDLSSPIHVSVPSGRTVKNLQPDFVAAAELHAPLARRGTASLGQIDSFIAWVNRHKGDGSVIFAATGDQPSLTAIIDYNLAGAPSLGEPRDPLARHGKHRAQHAFPVSDEWNTWTAASGASFSGSELGEFIETHAQDLMAPTPALLGTAEPTEAWERDMIATAAKMQGRFGTYTSIIQLAREFNVQETSKLQTSTNRDTGETTVIFIDEHTNEQGAPIRIPNLFLIAIPVFENGPAYRIPVRFRYRKKGPSVEFILQLYRSDLAKRDAVDEALKRVVDETDLPLFIGSPEA